MHIIVSIAIHITSLKRLKKKIVTKFKSSPKKCSFIENYSIIGFNDIFAIKTS